MINAREDAKILAPVQHLGPIICRLSATCHMHNLRQIDYKSSRWTFSAGFATFNEKQKKKQNEANTRIDIRPKASCFTWTQVPQQCQLRQQHTTHPPLGMTMGELEYGAVPHATFWCHKTSDGNEQTKHLKINVFIIALSHASPGIDRKRGTI